VGASGREITLYRFGGGESCILTANAVLSGQTFPAIATVEEDADGEPLVQVTELNFQRDEWTQIQRRFRVIAVRRRDRDTGKQIPESSPHLSAS